MRRLVVADVLPGDRDPILRIVHQRVEAIGCRDCRRVDPQRGVVVGAPDDLFAPVTQDVGRQRRRRLGAVVGARAGRGQHPDDR